MLPLIFASNDLDLVSWPWPWTLLIS